MRFVVGVVARTTLAVAVCLAGFLMAPFAFPFTMIGVACLWFAPLAFAVWSRTRPATEPEERRAPDVLRAAAE